MAEKTYISNLPEDLRWVIQEFVHKSQMVSIKKEIIKSPLVLDKKFQEDYESRERVTAWINSIPVAKPYKDVLALAIVESK